jgi:hypothetical protein
MPGHCDCHEPGSSNWRYSYYLGDFRLFRVGLPEEKRHYFEGQGSFASVLRSLDHRASSPHCHPERSRGTLCWTSRREFSRTPPGAPPFVFRSVGFHGPFSLRIFVPVHDAHTDSFLPLKMGMESLAASLTLNDSRPQSTRPVSLRAKPPVPQVARSHAPSTDPA